MKGKQSTIEVIRDAEGRPRVVPGTAAPILADFLETDLRGDATWTAKVAKRLAEAGEGESRSPAISTHWKSAAPSRCCATSTTPRYRRWCCRPGTWRPRSAPGWPCCASRAVRLGRGGRNESGGGSNVIGIREPSV